MAEAARGGGGAQTEGWAAAGRAAGAVDAAPAARNEPSTPRPCGACHKCGAQVKDATRVLVCDTCGCRYHTFDCGSRIYCAGVTVGPEASACPRCCGLCACGGGKVLCHTAAQRQKRKEAGAASLRRKRQVVGKASPRGPAGKGSGSGGATGTPSASASEDTSGIASIHARRGVKAEHGTPGGGGGAFSGLAGLAALAGAVSEPQLALRASPPPPPVAAAPASAAQHTKSMQIASYYALQTELLLFKSRAAQLEMENAALRRMLQGGAVAPQQAALAAPGAPAQPQQSAQQPAALQLLASPPPASGAAAAWAAQSQNAASNIASALSAALAAQGGGFNPAAGGGGDMMTFAQNLPLLIALAQQQRSAAVAAAPAS